MADKYLTQDVLEYFWNKIKSYGTATFSSKEHTHPSGVISSLEGYSKAKTASPVSEADTLNAAIGKIEAGLDEAVHKSGNENVSGTKTFSAAPVVKASAVDKSGTENASETESAVFYVKDASNASFAQINARRHDSAGINELRLRGTNAGGKWADLRLQFSDDNTYGLYLAGSGGMASQGFLGNASTASALKTARKLKADLSATADAPFDGSADQTAIPVQGVLPASKGGTGLSTLDSFVRTTGTQEIGGEKTFTEPLNASITGTAAMASADADGNAISTTYAKAASAALTGTPTAPNPSAGDSSTRIATTKFVSDAIAAQGIGAMSEAIEDQADQIEGISDALDGKLDSSSSAYLKSISIDGTQVTVVKGDGSSETMSTQDRDTHWTTKAVVGAADGTSSSAVDNPYLRIFDNNTARATFQISGSGSASVSSDSLGNITVSSTDTTYGEMAGASQSRDGTSGLVPAPEAEDAGKFLRGDGTWALPEGVDPASAAPLASGTASVGASLKYAREDHVHPEQEKISAVPEGTTYVAGASAGKALVTSETTSYGAVFNAPTKTGRVSLGTNPSSNDLVSLMSFTSENVASGTNTARKTLTWNASDGTLTVDRIVADIAGDVTGNVTGSSGSCTGNAATASKFAASQTISLSGDVSGSASSQAGWSISTTLKDVLSGTGAFGPDSASETPAHGASFKVPYVTVDSKGRVTAISNRTVTLPASGNTDVKVRQETASDDAERPILARKGVSDASGTANYAAYDSGVTVNASTHKVTASGGFVGDLEGTAESALTVPWSGIEDRPSTFTPAEHSHSGSDVSLTGYAKASSASAVSASDSVSAAIGKLEKALDGKQASGSYASASHNQASSTINAMTGYSKPSSTGAIGTSDTLNGAIGKLEKALDGKASSSHSHPASDITLAGYSKQTTAAPVDETDSVYTAIGKLEKALDGKQAAGSYAASSHNQASSTINAMTGYSKPSSTSAIAASDTLNAAIGKLEKALDGKQASGSYAAASHNQASNTINAMTGYVKASSAGAISTTDTLNSAIGKLEKALDGKQASGSYAASSHTHSSSSVTAMTDYAKASSAGAISTSDTLNSAIGKLEKALDGKANTSHGTHVSFSTDAPKAAGTASAGGSSTTTVAKSDHVHPLQTSVSGNAGTATKFSEAQTVELKGAVTGSASSQAGWTVTTTLADSGVTADTYGSTAQQTPAHGSTFSIPYVTVDAKGRVTAAGTSTVKLPADSNTDTKVNVTLGTTTKAYLLGTSTTPTSTAAGVTAISDTGVYLDTTAGRLTAGSFAGNGQNITLATANAIVTTDANKKLTASTSITATELGYLDGVTSSIQTQLNGKAASSHSHDASDISSGTLDAARIPSLDASKITSGTIDIARLPAGALERLVIVDNETKRFALTAASVQIGDTVKQEDTGQMYFVVDTSKLDSAAGYEEYTAGSATSVPWSGVTGKPSTFAPAAHNQASSTINAMTGYSKPSSTSAIGTSDTLNSAIGKLEKALDGKQASGSYASSTHSHTGADIPLTGYAKASSASAVDAADSANAAIGKLEKALDGKAATTHSQTSSTINAMTGYSKPSSTSAISANDTLNAAIGKLEKALDGKQASGSYASASHNQASSTINAMTGYSKASAAAAIAETDTLNAAIGKLEKALDGKQASGSYLTSSSSLNAAKLTGTAAVNTTGKATTAGTADKVASSLTLKVKSGTTEGTDLYTFNGSGAKTIDIKQGSNVTLTAAEGSLTIAAKDTVYTHPTTSGNKHIPSGGSSGQILRWSADGTAAWGADNNTTYSNFVKSGSGAAAGLVPAPSTTAGTTKYLREDGTWQVPPDNNTVYTHPTTSGNKHVPSGGSSGQFLGWDSDGTAKWVANPNADTKVKQYVGNTSTERPILSRYTIDEASQTANYVVYDTGVTNNPNKHTLTSSGGFIGKLSGTPEGTSFVDAVKEGKALVNATTTGYGGIWNAPTKNYRVGCSTYPSSGDDVRIAYSVTNANVTAGTNTVAKSLTWNADSGTLTATAFSGPLTGNVTGNVSGSSGSCTGNAATATKFASAQSVALTGAVTGTASSQAGWSVSTVWRSCMVGQSGSTTTNPWYKVATFAVTTANDDIMATFLVEDTYSSHKQGILKVHVRTDGSKVISSTASDLIWLSHTGFTLADFVLVCPTAASSTVEIWTKIATAYMHRRFTVLSEGSRSSTSIKWTLLNASSAGQAASITTTGTQIASTFTGQAASCTGNAATATKLATARSINGTNFDGSAAITTANWGTARNISISDSDGTNTGTAVSVNGSAAVTLKLPATIKASISGNATNVTGTVAIANGGTGATTRLNAIKALVNENVSTNATHFLGLKSDWSKVGYVSAADAKTVLGLKSAAYTESSAYATSSHALSVTSSGDGNAVTGISVSNHSITVLKSLDFATAGHTHSYLPLAGGTMTGNVVQKFTAYERGVSTTAYTRELIDVKDKNDVRFALIETNVAADKSSKTCIFAYKTTAASGNNIGSLGIGCDASGNVYTVAPTPATADNSTKIATTAYVKAQGYITGSGNAATATKLATARTINGVSFDGSANITVADSTKVAKAGDTMTGNLTISKAGPVLCTKSTGMTRNTAPSAAVNTVEILGQDNAGKSTWGIYHTYGTDMANRAQLIAYNGKSTDNTWSGIGIGYDASGNVSTNAPTPAFGDNTTKIATTAFVYSNAAKHLAAATSIYVAKAATGNGSGSNTSNYMSLADLRNYLATVHMHSSTADMNGSYTLTILFKAGESFGNASFDATKMPGIRNLVLNTSTGTASTTSNYSTNSPTFGNISVSGDIAVTIRNINCTGRISAQYGAYVAVDTYVGLSSLHASNWAYVNVAKNMVIDVCDAHTDYLFAAMNSGILAMWPGATVTINFRQQCYYTRCLFMSSTNGTIFVGYSSFKLTGTKPVSIWAGSGTLTGTSETAAGTAAKVVPLASGQTFTLATNATAKVRFTNDNTAANPTLNINSTGAKAIWWNGAAVAANMLAKNMTYDVKYDGTRYVIQNVIKRLTNNDFGIFRYSGDYATTYNSGSWNFSDWTPYFGTGLENSTFRGSLIGNIQQNVTTSNNTYPVLFTGTANATANTSTYPYFGSGVKINPSTSTIYATTFSGNVTGSSGSCTGNAATTTKLATARTIGISGGATGTATSFDGSGNITIPVTALDVSKASAGTLAVARGGTGLTSLDTFVRTTGNQTIAGTKTFSAEIMVNKGDKPAAGALSHAFGVTYQNTGGTQTHTAHPISVIGTSNADNAYNTGVRLGSLNGTTVVSAGESGGTFCTKLSKFDDENLYLEADGEVQIYCKCANDMATYAGPIRFYGSANDSGGTTTVAATNFAGNASTATKLATARSLWGNNFDGSAAISGSITISAAAGKVVTKNSNVTRNTAPSANQWNQGLCFQDKNGVALGGVEHGYLTDKTNRLNLIVYKGTTTDTSANAQISIGYDKDGNAFTAAPTPATADNSTKIATTAFVKAQGYITSSGTASNVSGTVAIANGGTGATTRLNALKALTNENVGTNATYFLTITDSWGKGGYTSVANAKTVLGLGSAAYTASTDYATSGHTHSYVPLSGGTMTGSLTQKHTGLVKGSAVSAWTCRDYRVIDNSGDSGDKPCLSWWRTAVGTDKKVSVTINAFKFADESTASASIGIHYPVDGDAYTSAPTPATADNSTKIATTAYVKAQGYITGSGNTTGSSGSCTGNAATATTLKTARKINGVSFNGSADITVADSTKLPLAGGTMTGNITLTDKSILFDNSTLDYNAAPSANVTQGGLYWRDKNDKYVARMLYYKNTDKTMGMSFGMCKHGTTNSDGYTTLLGMSMNADGSVKYASCPTPAAGDSSTKIATTAFVASKFHFSTSAPSDSTGANGDLWYQYV